MEPRHVQARRGVGIALFVAAMAASLLGELPRDLPDVALGWPLLLHLERAAAVVAILGVLLLVIWRAGRGQFPIRFGQIEYEVEGPAAAATKETLLAHEARILLIEQVLRVRDEDLDDTGSGA